MRRKGLKKNKKGFTLVEVIVVLVIIGILLALAVPAITQYIGKAGDTKIATQIKSAFTAAQTLNTSNIAENPDAESTALADLITKENVNKELGVEESNKAAVDTITCDVDATSKRITECTISTIESKNTYKIKPNEEPVKDDAKPTTGE